MGQPIVFFHGWGFDSHIWHHLIPTLSPQYQMILVDLPGFGQTPSMSWEIFNQLLLDQLPPRFKVIGWSLGGLYATRLALEQPARIEHLINVSSSPRFIRDQNWPGVSSEVFSGFNKNIMMNPSRTLQDFIALQAGKAQSKVKQIHIPSSIALQEGLNILESWDLRDSLAEGTLPISYMFGRLDPITPIRTMNAMQEVYPQFHYVLFNKAAHMPFLSHQDEFVHELLGFIS